MYVKKGNKDIEDGSVLETVTVTPTDFLNITMRYADMLKETIVPWSPSVMDEFLIPLHAGQMILFQGRPGDAKTTLSLAMANIMGLAIKDNKNIPYGPPLFVTAETVTQDMMLYLTMERLNSMGAKNSVTNDYWNIEDVYRSRYKRSELLRGAVKLSDLNISMLGQDAEKTGYKIDVELVWRAVQEMEKLGKRPLYIIMDYAQKLDVDDEKFGNTSYHAKDATIFSEVDQFCVATGIPVHLLAQSNEWVDDLQVPIGTAKSIHGTSYAHRYAATHVAIMRPGNHEQYSTDEFGEKPLVIDTGLGKYPNVPNLQIMRDLKQRGKKPGSREIAIIFDPGKMTISELNEGNIKGVDFGDFVNYSTEELSGHSDQEDWHLG